MKKLFDRNYLLWMAWRNLVSPKKQRGLSFMTVFSIIGIALGVAVLMTVLSVMGGFEADLVSKMLRGQPHLEVTAEQVAAGFPLVEHSVESFEKLVPEATGIEPYTQADVVIKQKRHLASATLFGVDPMRKGHLWGFGGAMIEGQMADLTRLHAPAFDWNEGDPKRPGIVLGVKLASQLGADVGDEIVVLSPQVTAGSVLAGATVSRTYVVIGKFQTDIFNHDAKWAVVNLSEGRRFLAEYDPSLERDQFVSGVAINLAAPQLVDGAEARLQKLDGLSARSWKKANKSLLFALKLEKFAMGSILMLVVIVAAFSISGTLMMTVYHRRSHISLLRSIGMSRRDIAKLFMVHGLTIGMVGVGCGVVLGLVLCLGIHEFFLNLPPGVYHLKALPVKFLPFDYLIIAASALGFSLAAATYPALTAAKHDPSGGLRYS